MPIKHQTHSLVISKKVMSQFPDDTVSFQMVDSQTIIETIISYGYDDDRESISYVKGVLAKRHIIPEEQIKDTIIKELNILKTCIENNLKNEIIILPESDFKFSHWTALNYILCRHFTDKQNPSQCPMFYQNIAKETNKREDRTCIGLIVKLLTILND